jgi:[glutamine synthetase] adenylyltransferase / [glutamine synthetase]-adenylyl-L-tyrosine phosphorylase
LSTSPILSDSFRDALVKLTAGYFPIEKIEEITGLFERALQKQYISSRSENNLLRIFNALFDRIYFFEVALRYPLYSEITCAIAAHSNYLTDIIAANPEYLTWILSTGVLNTKPTKELLQKEIESAVKSHKQFPFKSRALKSIKRKYMLAIGIQDILGISTFEETVAELSHLAQLLAAELFTLCYQETLARFNITKSARKYCLLSLGKLGGDELNYSSDIDLMLFYDKDQNLKGGRTYKEVLSEAARLFIKQATVPDDKGTLYRIDFRLRPDGNSAPLCHTLDECIKYYESRGEDWERLMLLKANFVTGTPKLYADFKKSVIPFVFPVAFSQSPKEQIKRLRQVVLSSAPDQRNIKLAAGGIRDIEFPIQTLQLLNGGRYADLRTGNTLTALSRLVKHHLASEEEQRSLGRIYIFYRRIEHYLQLMNNLQTHTFPEQGELTESLSAYLGFENVDAFNVEVESMQEAIRRFAHSVMQDEDIEAENIMHDVPFTDSTKAWKNMEFLQYGKGLLDTRQFDKKTSDSFMAIAEVLREYLCACSAPDLVLDNFSGIIRRTFIPSLWYELFRNKPVMKAFLRVCEFSQKSVNALVEYTQFHEDVLSGVVFDEFTPENSGQYSIREIMFILSFQLTIGIITPNELSKLLTAVVRKRISNLIEEIIAPNFDIDDYVVFYLGSLSTEEMTFSSDVDLLFICRDNKKYPSAQDDFAALLDRIKKSLAPLQVDCRLRPEGSKGVLVIDIPHYIPYVRQRMRIWEMQAMTKMYLASGSIAMYQGIQVLLEDNLHGYTTGVILEEITGMRKRVSTQQENGFHIKRSLGGLTDIEFSLQYLILKHGYLSLCGGLPLSGQIAELVKAKALKKQQGTVLYNNYRMLKELEIAVQNLFDMPSAVIKDEVKFRGKIAAYLQKNPDILIEEIETIITENKNLFSLLMQ